MIPTITTFPSFEPCKQREVSPSLSTDSSSHSFVNQFEKMDRTKTNTHYRDIVCGPSFDATEILQELARLRQMPVEAIQNKQEDAHELLCQLLNEIHDEICQIVSPSSTNKNGKRAGEERERFTTRSS